MLILCDMQRIFQTNKDMKIANLPYIFLVFIGCNTPKPQIITPVLITQYDTIVKSNTVIHLDTIRQYDTLQVLANCDTLNAVKWLFVPCPISQTIVKTIVKKDTTIIRKTDNQRVQSLQVTNDSLIACLWFSEQTIQQLASLTSEQKTLLNAHTGEINRLKRAKHRKSILVAFLLLTLLGLSLNTLLTCKRNATYGI